jgi:hypothetical protein
MRVGRGGSLLHASLVRPREVLNPNFPDGFTSTLTSTSDSCMGLKDFVAVAGVEHGERDG